MHSYAPSKQVTACAAQSTTFSLDSFILFFLAIFSFAYLAIKMAPLPVVPKEGQHADTLPKHTHTPLKYIARPAHTKFSQEFSMNKEPVRAEAQHARLGPHEHYSVQDAKRAVVGAMVNTTGKTRMVPGRGKFDVVKMKSNKDGRMYFVADGLPDKSKAVDLLAEISRRQQYLLQSIDEQLDGNRRMYAADGVDVTDNMKTLLRKHYKKEVLLAEYHNPDDLTVGSNSDKGVMIETCLRSKSDPNQWSSINSLFRVHCHELAHSADFEYRDDGENGHGPVFKRLHILLLGISENLGLYNCAEYTKSGGALCGVTLTESYMCGDAPKKQESEPKGPQKQTNN